jgi:hypothetical protein
VDCFARQFAVGNLQLTRNNGQLPRNDRPAYSFLRAPWCAFVVKFLFPVVSLIVQSNSIEYKVWNL